MKPQACSITLDRLVKMMEDGSLIGKSVRVFRPEDAPLFCDVVAVRFSTAKPSEGRFAASAAGPWYPICAITKVYA